MYNWQSIIEGDGLTLMGVGMLVVFMALVVLLILMKGLKYSFIWKNKLKILITKDAALEIGKRNEIQAGVVAAIAITLILEDDQIHDNESLVLTMQAMSKPYSNWWIGDMAKPWRSWLHRQRGEPPQK